MKKNLPYLQEIKFKEFPELLFGKSPDNLYYFDATEYLHKKQIDKTIQGFQETFIFWINAILIEYNDVSLDDLVIMNETDGHILVEETLALLFIAYTDPSFGIYMLDRITEMLMNGLVLSDSMILVMANNRLSQGA